MQHDIMQEILCIDLKTTYLMIDAYSQAYELLALKIVEQEKNFYYHLSALNNTFNK